MSIGSGVQQSNSFDRESNNGDDERLRTTPERAFVLLVVTAEVLGVGKSDVVRCRKVGAVISAQRLQSGTCKPPTISRHEHVGGGAQHREKRETSDCGGRPTIASDSGRS